MFKLKYLPWALSVLLAAALIFVVIPGGKPTKPVYVQRVEALMHALERGDWKAACKVAPTATAEYSTFTYYAQIAGVSTPAQLEKFCERVMKAAVTDERGKLRSLTWRVDYWTSEEKATAQTVILELRIGSDRNVTYTLSMGLTRTPWVEKATAKCDDGSGHKVACPPVRWYVLKAS